MIARLRHANGEQRKLLFSLGTNFLTRIPGAVGLLWFLPLLRFGLGTDDYANLFASMALGTATTFLIGGFSVIGRRIVGAAYAQQDHADEANGFASLVIANLMATGIACAIIVIYCQMRAVSAEILLISLLPAVGAFLMTFDNVRLAYNEHYVTAILQLILQTAIYTVGFFVPLTRHNIIFASLIIQGHYMLSSLITCGMLLRGRPYLFGGRPVMVWQVIREGAILAMADGFLMATLGLLVVWLQAVSNPTTSAWFATVVRLFQTFLTPVILLLMPLSSYIRLLWHRKSVTRQQIFAKVLFWSGIGYGMFVAISLFIASRFYVDDLLHLPAPGRWFQILPIFLLFGAIVAYKGYSSIAYIVMDGSTHLSSWTTIVISVAVVLGAVASFAVEPLDVINIYSVTTGLLVIVVLFWNAARFVRVSPLPGE